MATEYDLSFKIVLIGDSGVGKTSLLASFARGSFTVFNPTISPESTTLQLSVGGKEINLTIWDTAGQEKHKSLTRNYYRDAHGIVLVYDVTQKYTFTNLANFWLKEVELNSTNKDCVKILVGNKVDKGSERKVTVEEGKELAKKNGFLFLESSAKTRENVEKCFEDLALKMLEDLEKKRRQEEQKKKPEPRVVDIINKPATKPPEPRVVDIKKPATKTPAPYTGVPGGGCGDSKCCH